VCVQVAFDEARCSDAVVAGEEHEIAASGIDADVARGGGARMRRREGAQRERPICALGRFQILPGSIFRSVIDADDFCDSRWRTLSCKGFDARLELCSPVVRRDDDAEIYVALGWPKRPSGAARLSRFVFCSIS